MKEAIEFWKCAGTFPPDKENVYPEHVKAQEFDQHKGKVVLEYGCGGGSDTMSYLRRGCTVHACDIVPDNIRMTVARAKAEKFPATARLNMHWLKESAKIPVDDKTVDVASAHGVLHHIKDAVPALKEMRRTMKKGGLVYVMLYTERLFSENEATVKQLMEAHGIAKEQAFGWITDGQGCPYTIPYTEKEGREFLSSAGFKQISAYEYHNGLFRTFQGKA